MTRKDKKNNLISNQLYANQIMGIYINVNMYFFWNLTRPRIQFFFEKSVSESSGKKR